MPDYPTENRNFFLPIQIEYDSDYYVQLQQKFLEYCEHVNEELPIWNSFNNSQHRICWDANYIKQQVKYYTTSTAKKYSTHFFSCKD